MELQCFLTVALPSYFYFLFNSGVHSASYTLGGGININRFAEKINTVVEVLIVLMLSAMTFIVFLQVVSRYFFDLPLFWTEEAARYLMIWIVYIGASVGMRRGSHIGFSYFVDKASPKIARWLYLIANLGLLAFCLNITYYGTIITLANTSQLSGGLQIPIAAVYAALPIAGILCIIQLIPIITKLLGLTNLTKKKRYAEA